jgi:hypothetical protein
MVLSSLQDFAAGVLARKRIGKRDVQHLQRDLLADGIMNRDEAEILIALDREAEGVHASWPGFFIAMLTDFAVWGSRPTGIVDADTAQWLAATLMRDNRSPRAARVLAEVLKEAQQVDGTLTAGAGGEQPAPPDLALERALAA